MNSKTIQLKPLSQDTIIVPGGNTEAVQFNNAGAFGGVDNFYWDIAGDILFIGDGASTGFINISHNGTQGSFENDTGVMRFESDGNYSFTGGVNLQLEESGGGTDVIELAHDGTVGELNSSNGINIQLNATTLGVNNAYTLPGADGNSGDLLITNGTGTVSFVAMSGDATIDQNGVITVTATTEAQFLVLEVLKDSAGTINPGEVVRVVSFDVGNDVPTVELAQANSATTMPAIGIARDTITDTVSGKVVVSGRLGGQNTSSFSVGDELFVSPTVAGGLTATKPTGAANLIQKISQVTEVNATTGEMQVFGAGRANDLPNLLDGNIWVGNGSDVPTATPLIFGTEFEEDFEATEQSTTSGTYVTPYSYTTASLPAGDYRIDWLFDAGLKSDKEASHRVTVDGAEVSNAEWRIKEGVENDGTAWFPFSGHRILTLAAGTHTIAVQYRADDIAYVRNKQVSIFRVA